MSIRLKNKKMSKPVVDLDGSNGNAFALMGMASQFARASGIDPDIVLDAMKDGDYINLLKVFDEYFGDFIILETDNPEYIEALNAS